MSNAFQGVSWSNPFGTNQNTGLNKLNSATGGLLGDSAKLTGLILDPVGDIQQNTNIGTGYLQNPTRSNPNDPESPLHQTPSSTSTNPNGIPPNALTSLAAPNNTSEEDALRQVYQNALSPNYGFQFQGQNNPNQFSSVPGAKGR